MELQIRTNGIKVSEGLKEFIDRRMSKLDRLANQIVDAKLELKAMTNRGATEHYRAQLTLKTRKHTLRAEAEDPEVAHAIDVAIDKLIRQVHNYVKRRTDRRQAAPPLNELVEETYDPDTDLPADFSLDALASDNLAQIQRTKQFQMDPIGVETAIEQMELIGHDFFFFRNAEDNTFSVLYRRRDGSLGLLSPES